MKFLFKITFLVMVCISNFALSITMGDIMNQIEQKEKVLLEKINDKQNQIEQVAKKIEQITKVTENIDEIINSFDCNCIKLNLLNNEELNIAQAQLFGLHGYTTPKSEKRIKKEKEDLTKLFHNFLLDNLGKEGETILKQRIENIKEVNEKMKCMQKILITINEKLKNQNKSQ